MKLLLCKNCTDIFSLEQVKKTCTCGKTSGVYIDNVNAVCSGNYVAIGFSNRTLLNAINNQPDFGDGYEFTAFVIPKNCKSIINKL